MPDDEPVINAVGLSCDSILISQREHNYSGTKGRYLIELVAAISIVLILPFSS